MIRLLWMRMQRYFIGRELWMIDIQIEHAAYAKEHNTRVLADLNQRIAQAEIMTGRLSSY